jgi:hypothetical protein
LPLQPEDDSKSVIYEKPPSLHNEDIKSVKSTHSKNEQPTRSRTSSANPDEIIHPEPVYIDNASEHIYQTPNSVIDDSHHYETVADHINNNRNKNGMDRPHYPAPVAPPLPDFAQLKVSIIYLNVIIPDF